MKITKGSIYATGSKKNPWEICFAVTYDSNEQKRIKLRGTSKEEVLQKKQSWITENMGGSPVCGVPAVPAVSVPAAMTFREVAEEFFHKKITSREKYNGRGTSYKNKEGIRYALDCLYKEIGSTDIKRIDTVLVNDCLAKLSFKTDGEVKSRSTVIKYRDNLLNVMKYAYTQGYTDKMIGEVILNRQEAYNFFTVYLLSA